MKNLLAILLCLLVVHVTAQVEIVEPESVGLSSDRLQRVEQLMKDLTDQGMISGMEVAILRKDKLAFHKTYGQKSIENESKLALNDLWRIYSMTKPIVSVGLMMLYEEGKFQLDDPIHLYMPEFKEMKVHVGNGKTEKAKNPIRVVDILRHTSGLGYGWSGGYVDTLYAMAGLNVLAPGGPEKPKTVAEFTQRLSQLPLYNEPGTKWQYSMSTDVCGRLIEVLSGQPLDIYLKEHIFEPLGMEDTFFEVPDEKDNRFVTMYTTSPDGKLIPADVPSSSPFTSTVTAFSGGGGLVSSTMDYMTFCHMLLNEGIYNGHRFLSPKTLELMTLDHSANQPYASGPVVYPNEAGGFGLGFAVTKNVAASGNLGSLGTYGWGGAAGTVFRIDPEEDLAYVMMIQLMPYNHLKARAKVHSMIYQAIIE